MIGEHSTDARVRRWQALTLLMFAIGAMMSAVRAVDVDVGWLLTLGEKMLDGQRPYIDVFEANPPMSILLYLPAVALGRIAHIAPEDLVNVLVLLASGVSLGLSGKIVSRAIGDRETLWKLAAGGAFVLTVLPTGVFTEREHIAVIAILPFLALSIARGEGAKLGVWLSALAGIGCGVAMAIKPHFALAAGPPVLLAAVRLRSPRPIFAVEIWAASLVVGLYALLLVVAFPAFLAFLPVIHDVYLPVRRPLAMLLLELPPAPAWLGLGVLSAWTSRERPGGAWAAGALFAASAGGAAAYLIQGKGWPYHTYPMLALGLLALIAAGVLGERRTAKSRKLEPIAIARLVIALGVVAGTMRWFTEKGDYHALNAPVAAIEAHPRLLSISPDIALGHPLVRELHGRWVGSVCSQWISAGVLTLELRGGLSAARRARLDGMMAFDRRLLAADIRRGQPDIILIEQQYYDWAGWAKVDPALAAALDAYAPVETVQGVTIWARKNRART
ncbi:MAG: hypothetical protein P4L64_18235 [Caulobacteraceae bacterium]|nr:hypothetical protein [Caulobacteraceae bacterium]